MSVRLMAQVFELGIPAREKLVLLAMADHARDDGTGCYPSVERLARKTSQSRRGVQKVMRRLEQAGLIVPTGNLRGGRNLATEYRVTLENREPDSLFSPGKGRTPEQKTANGRTEKGRTPFAPTVRSSQPSGTVISKSSALPGVAPDQGA
jgi:pyocin large subunit-like protein